MVLDMSTVFVLAVTALLGALGVMLFVACRNEKNTLELTQLIATRTQDGREVVDIDKVGKTVALFVFTGIVILQAHRNLLNDTTLLLYISYCAGVAGFSSYLRAKAGVSNGGKEYANGTAGKA